MKPADATLLGWHILTAAIRLCGMRGDTHRPEVRRFVPIFRRHAMRVDPVAFRSLRTGARANLLSAPRELVALACRSRGFQKEFAAAEARRFQKDDRPALDAFRTKVRDIVTRAKRISDAGILKDALATLGGLRAWLPYDCYGREDYRWRREGNAVIDAAIAQVEREIGRCNRALQIGPLAADVREIRANQISEKDRRSARAHAIGKKGGRPRSNPNISHHDLMLMIKRRHRPGTLIKTAIADTIAACAQRGILIEVKPETLCKQYGTWRRNRSDKPTA